MGSCGFKYIPVTTDFLSAGWPALKLVIRQGLAFKGLRVEIERFMFL